MRPSRRQLLSMIAAAAAAPFAPFRAARAGVAGERKFIFFYASGGWDVTSVFDPHFDVDGVDMDAMAEPGQVGNIAYTSGADRPNVDRYLQRWGDRTCFVNGLNVHSVGHESAMQFVMTGTSASSYPDWPTLLAAQSNVAYPMPHVVFGGPNFPGTSGSSVVRAGGGALINLLDASVLGQVQPAAAPFSAPSDRIMDAFVYDRVARFAANRTGVGRTRADGYLGNLDRDMELEGRAFEAGLTDLGSTMVDQGVKAAEMIRLGLCRCAMIGIDGGFDTHAELSQADNFDAWFSALDTLMEYLARTPGYSTPRLLDEVVLVGLSEFGRTPKYNGAGRDHWPFGSAFLAGSGIQGDQSVGATDDELIALPIDLSTGRHAADGDVPACENLGVALLELGGVDPERHLPGVPSLAAVRA